MLNEGRERSKVFTIIEEGGRSRELDTSRKKLLRTLAAHLNSFFERWREMTQEFEKKVQRNGVRLSKKVGEENGS